LRTGQQPAQAVAEQRAGVVIDDNRRDAHAACAALTEQRIRKARR